MTALAARNDAQRVLDRPLTLADAGRQITAEHTAMRNLLAVAEDEVRWRDGSPTLRAAVNDVREAARG